MTRSTVALAAMLMFIFPALLAAATAEEEFSEADRLFSRGAFEDSVAHWRTAASLFDKRGEQEHFLEAEIRLAAAFHALGQSNLAIEILTASQQRTVEIGDKRHLASIKAALGAIYILSAGPMASPDHSSFTSEGTNQQQMMPMHEMPDIAETMLKESLTLSRNSKDRRVEAEALNSLGNLCSYRNDYESAAKQYKAAIELGTNASAREVASQACANLARAAIKAGNYEDAKTWADRTATNASELKDSHTKANILLSAGRIFDDLFLLGPDHDNNFRLRAFEVFQRAAAVAQAIEDKRALSYVSGYEGKLYEAEKKYDEALALTRQAAFLAQELNSPDILYRWQWQTGRLLHAKHEDDAAIAAYRRAVETLQSIRHDVSLRYGNTNAHSSFREVAGELYFQLADLLLQRADSAANPADLERMLVEARDATELLKSAELEDYFQDQCVNLLKSKLTKVETVSSTAAIVYIIPLENRTELLVSLATGLYRVKSPVTATTLTDAAHKFRFNLEKRTTYEYLEQAKQLYDWLIRPLEPLLKEGNPDTLVFIPDGALRNIPMAALNDGEKYLIERYAVAVSPGLTLMEPRPFNKENIQLVVNGLSDGVQGFSPLQYVPGEVTNLKRLFGGTELMNREFVKPNVQKEFAAEENYSIVHIASHGHFDSDAKKTFVLTFDSKLTLDELEQLLRPSQLRDKPVELLTLSACQTAAGDDRAALGLAGVAIKAGARSAFATLWFVNDQSSALLVSDFYTQLRDHPAVSKAKALQAAQIKLMRDQRYAHPCYWAPYLIIGNWL